MLWFSDRSTQRTHLAHFICQSDQWIISPVTHAIASRKQVDERATRQWYNQEIASSFPCSSSIHEKMVSCGQGASPIAAPGVLEPAAPGVAPSPHQLTNVSLRPFQTWIVFVFLRNSSLSNDLGISYILARSLLISEFPYVVSKMLILQYRK